MIGGLWWFVLVSLAIASIVLQHGLLFLFTTLLMLGTLASLIWARYCLAGVTYRRTLGTNRLEYGQETELTVEIVNAKPLPLAWLRIQDEWPKPITLLTGRLSYSHKPNRSLLYNWLAMRWYERVRRVYRVQGSQRGAFEFGPVRLTSGDLFGFRRRERKLETTEKLLVYPLVVPVWEWRLPSGRPLGETLAARRVVDDPLRFAGVRDYVPGDNPRHIDWKSSARWQHLQSRTFDPEASPAVILVVDVKTSDLGTYWVAPAYLELIVSAAASLACEALDLRRAVGLYANAYSRQPTGIVHVPASRDPAQRTRLLEALTRLMSLSLWPCATMIREQLRTLPFGATVVAITAQPVETLQTALLALKDKGHPIVLLTVGEEATQGPADFDMHYLGGQLAWQNLAALELD